MGTRQDDSMEEKSDLDRAGVEDLLLGYVRALCKPLEYVAANEFANLGTVKELDKAVLAVVQKAMEAARSPEQGSVLQRIRKDFESFAQSTLKRKKEAVQRALGALKGLEKQVRALPSAPDGAGRDGLPGEKPAVTKPVMSGATGSQDAVESMGGTDGISSGVPGRAGTGGGDSNSRSARDSGNGPSAEAGRREDGSLGRSLESGSQGASASRGDGRKQKKKGAKKSGSAESETKGGQSRKSDSSAKTNRSKDQAGAPGRRAEAGRRKSKRVNRRTRKVVAPVFRNLEVGYTERSDQDLSWGRPRRTALLQSPSRSYVQELPPAPGTETGEGQERGTQQANVSDATKNRKKNARRGRRKKAASPRTDTPNALDTKKILPPSGPENAHEVLSRDGLEPVATDGAASHRASAAPVELPPLGLPAELAPDGQYHDLTLGDIAEYIEKVEHGVGPATRDGAARAAREPHEHAVSDSEERVSEGSSSLETEDTGQLRPVPSGTDAVEKDKTSGVVGVSVPSERLGPDATAPDFASSEGSQRDTGRGSADSVDEAGAKGGPLEKQDIETRVHVIAAGRSDFTSTPELEKAIANLEKKDREEGADRVADDEGSPEDIGDGAPDGSAVGGEDRDGENGREKQFGGEEVFGELGVEDEERDDLEVQGEPGKEEDTAELDTRTPERDDSEIDEELGEEENAEGIDGVDLGDEEVEFDDEFDDEQEEVEDDDDGESGDFDEGADSIGEDVDGAGDGQDFVEDDLDEADLDDRELAEVVVDEGGETGAGEADSEGVDEPPFVLPALDLGFGVVRPDIQREPVVREVSAAALTDGEVIENLASLRDPLEDDGEATIEEFFEELVKQVGEVAPSHLVSDAMAESDTSGEPVAGARRGGQKSGRRKRGGRKRGSARATAGVGMDAPQGNDGDVSEKVEDKLARPLTEVKGIGAKLGAIFSRKGLSDVADLLGRFPISYHDRRHIRPLNEVEPGEQVVVVGAVESSNLESRGSRRDLVVVIRDESGSARLEWRAVRSNYLRNRFREGARLLAWGRAEQLEDTVGLIDPETEIVSNAADEEALSLGRIVPVYETWEGVGQKMLRRIVYEALETVRGGVPDPIPESLRARLGVSSLEDALRNVHFPPGNVSVDACLARTTPDWRNLALRELFLLEYALAYRRKVLANETGTARNLSHGRVSRLLREVSPLTDDQVSALEDIKRDLRSRHPMFRYLHADPRGGVLPVVVASILHTVDAGYQVAVLLPDEYVASQYSWVLRRLLQPLGVEPAALTSVVRGRAREKIALAIRRGECPLVVGTHDLLLSGKQLFKRLGLVVFHEGETIELLDRKKFRRPGNVPDVLVLSSHPVHPALLMTLHGDITWSELRTPEGRWSRIRTEVVTDDNKAAIEAQIKAVVKDAQQMVYCIPRVQEDDRQYVQAIMQQAGRLRDEVFPGIAVGYLHHQLHPAEQRTLVEKFVAREIQILVTPAEPDPRLITHRTSVLIVDRAEVLSSSRIHALRAMVARSFVEPAVYLAPASAASEEEMDRLAMVAETSDGFLLAQRDCERQGWRNYPGLNASPFSGLAAADLLVHQEELRRARREAFRWVDGSPEAKDAAAERSLARAARSRWPSLADSVPAPPEQADTTRKA